MHVRLSFNKYLNYAHDIVKKLNKRFFEKSATNTELVMSDGPII